MKWEQFEPAEKKLAVRCAYRGALFWGVLMAVLAWLAGVEFVRGLPLCLAVLLVMLGICMGFCFGAVVGIEFIRFLRNKKGGPGCE